MVLLLFHMMHIKLSSCTGHDGEHKQDCEISSSCKQHENT